MIAALQGQTRQQAPSHAVHTCSEGCWPCEEHCSLLQDPCALYDAAMATDVLLLIMLSMASTSVMMCLLLRRAIQLNVMGGDRICSAK